MSTPSLLDRTATGSRPVAGRVATEAEALEIAHRLAAQFAPGAAQRDRERLAPVAELDAYSNSGLWAISVPREHGGLQASYLTVARVFAIISAADPSIAQLAQNHFGYVNFIALNASAEQQRELFGAVLSGARIGNALSEKRNARDAKTRAHVGVFETRITAVDEARARVDGRKFYSTGALYADLVPVTATNAEGQVEVAFFDRHTSGLEVVDDWSSFGQRTTASGSVILDSAVLPRSRVVVGERPGGASSNGPVSQLLQAAIDLGIGVGALDDTLDYLRHRARPWIDSGVERACEDPLSLARLGRLATQREAADALFERAALAVDEADRQLDDETVDLASVAVAKAKVATTEFALEAAERLFELSGTSSTLSEFGYDRHWRNARVHTLHDPVRWKLHLLGNHLLNGASPKRHAWN
ncbi:SfnB family sulfur acquisition oxidoreductase [Halotalea alkalilenta]|uniref:SfnB family sulfur acquisition oxidoreductase n=1 Tax=Halotalea alkalilenta TaxID=376489 RepID=A0A172YIU8_9GAMM|nr:SfnB family sulfur acquisition oxidoreductase [Halotalea alkalilenta]ANF59102.1 SfnB family sulfur acquisition oxidoreductase [Halotalea alkalilenta]